MSFRTVVIENSAKLDYNMGFLVVRQSETTRIHVSEISMLIVESTAVSLTAALLSELTRAKVKVVFCDQKRQPSSELLPYYGCHDCSGKARSQIRWGDGTKRNIWTEIVAAKIRYQMAHLQFYNCPEELLLKDYLANLTLGDEGNMEGHAARVYFSALFGKDFSRTQNTSINAALNYGYSILLSMVNREIVCNGYLTQFGLFHDNSDNPFNLGSDLMEPFRILVDVSVRKSMPEQFETDEKREVLHLLEKELVIDGRNEYLPNAIRIYVKSVFDAINDDDVSKIKFYSTDELQIHESDSVF